MIADRVYDACRQPKAFPYVTVGDDQVLQDHAECLEGSVEVFAILNVWSRAVGKPETKRITGAIVAAINAVELSLAPDYRLITVSMTAAATSATRRPDLALGRHLPRAYR